MKSGKSRLLEDLEDDDPILSVVNLIDVFLGKGWRRQKPNRNFMQYGTDFGARSR